MLKVKSHQHLEQQTFMAATEKWTEFAKISYVCKKIWVCIKVLVNHKWSV